MVQTGAPGATQLISLADIEAARGRIAPYVAPTPIVTMNPAGLRLKAESLQPMGAFKIRGAFNAILCLTPDERAAGIVAHSSGNHAQAIAYAARRLGLKAIIVMPRDAPGPKIEGVRREGAEIVFTGPESTARAQKAAALAAELGLVLIEPFDRLEIMAGTGTIGLEILEQADDVEAVFAPVSGGGLLAGVATAIKQVRPSVRVIGVEPEQASDAAQSFRAGHLVAITAEAAASTIADGLRVQRLGALTWPHIHAFVDDIVTVSEDEIRGAMRAIAAQARLIAEPSGAAAIAGALASRADPARSVAILSGGNLDPKVYAQILTET